MNRTYLVIIVLILGIFEDINIADSNLELLLSIVSEEGSLESPIWFIFCEAYSKKDLGFKLISVLLI